MYHCVHINICRNNQFHVPASSRCQLPWGVSQVAGEGSGTTSNKVSEQGISGQIQTYSCLMTLPYGIIIDMDVLMILLGTSIPMIVPWGNVMRRLYIIYGVHVHCWFIYLFTELCCWWYRCLSRYLTYSP
uniref:Uncharacterized protein n=1 Tax=Oryza nivara TaxID=4536 RepID=A0A0E0IB44_ORYNI